MALARAAGSLRDRNDGMPESENEKVRQPPYCSGRGTWAAEKAKLHRQAVNTKWRTRCMTSGALDVPELRMWTTDSLSDQNCTRRRDHRGPHMCAATTTGTNSIKVIEADTGKKDQELTSHSCFHMTPKPWVPAASDA